MKRFMKIISGALLYLTVFGSTFLVAKNSVFNPEAIFETKKGGKTTVSRRTTKAEGLQSKGIQGQLKSGKRLTAAVIDMNFLPEYTKKLHDKGQIHPAALKDSLILHPDEHLEKESMKDLKSQINLLRTQAKKNPALKTENNKSIIKLKNTLARKIQYNDIYKDSATGTHGSAVMETINLMVPKAQFLPIDINVGDWFDMDHSSRIAWSILKAIECDADVINISLSRFEITDEIVQACKEASSWGIAIILAAGNESIKGQHLTFNQIWGQFNLIIKNPVYDLFKKINGKGIRFAGAVKYDKKGEEKVTYYSQHPTQATEKHFIFGAGDYLPVHYTINPDDYSSGGTSFAAPTIAGGYLLLKQFALENKYNLSSEELLEILHDSGRNVHYKPLWLGKEKVYKSMDLESAKNLIEAKMKLKSVKPVAVKSASIKPTPVKPKPVPVKVVGVKTVTVKSTPVKAAPVKPKPVPVKVVGVKTVTVKFTPVKAAPVKAVTVKKTPVKPVPVKVVGVKTVTVKSTPVKAAPIKAVTVKKTPVKPVPVKAVGIKPVTVKTLPTKNKVANQPVKKATGTRGNELAKKPVVKQQKKVAPSRALQGQQVKKVAPKKAPILKAKIKIVDKKVTGTQSKGKVPPKAPPKTRSKTQTKKK